MEQGWLVRLITSKSGGSTPSPLPISMKRLSNILLGLAIAGIAAAVFMLPWLIDETELLAK
jgi:hypothetical protein